jgi:hypothetical protein
MLTAKQSPEFIQDSRGGLALECANHVAQDDGRRVAHQEMDMVGVAIDLCDFAIAFGGKLPQGIE